MGNAFMTVAGSERSKRMKRTLWILAVLALVVVGVACDAATEEEVELSGPVDEVDAEGFVVDGQAVNVDDQTNFSPSQEDLQPGAEINVTARRDADGNLVAADVEIVEEAAEAGDDDGMMEELGGTVDQVDENSFVVSGVAVDIDEETQFTPSIGDLNEGAEVNVRARRNEEGELVAAEVEIMGPEEDENDDTE
jgi:hypothetical protein